MTDHNNKPFSEKDLLGSYSLVYFGFTNCPDICPDELDKMSAVVSAIGQSNWYYDIHFQSSLSYTNVRKNSSQRLSIAICKTYIYISRSCSWFRWTSSAVCTGYVCVHTLERPIFIYFLSHQLPADFHPRLIGLTGTYDAVKAMCKVYRVYFSSPPPKEGETSCTTPSISYNSAYQSY